MKPGSALLPPAGDSAKEKGATQLREFIAGPDFPCVGAKSALANGKLHIVSCWSIESGWDDIRIHSELISWANAYRESREGLRSLAFVFEASNPLSEELFEAAMWRRIQSIADKDDWLGLPYDGRVSSDPADPHFALSVGGEAYFVVGLHPNASRLARRAPRPTLVFNLHDQFEALRRDGIYDRMRSRILERDKLLAGDVNPMLAEHGALSAARQYSGRVVGDDWRCPFHDRRT